MDKIIYIQNHDIDNSIRVIRQKELIAYIENVVGDNISEIENFMLSHFVISQVKAECYQTIYEFCKAKCQELVKVVSLYPMYNKLPCDFTSILADALCELIRDMQWDIIDYQQKEDIRYSAVEEIECWCGWHLGKLLNDRKEYHTIDYLNFISECFLPGVLETFNIPDNLLEELMASDILRPINILKQKRVLDDEYTASAYIKEMESIINKEGDTDVDSLLAQSQYCQSNELIMMLSYNLMANNKYEMWAELFERLRYPILQSMMYLPYMGCNSYMEVLKVLMKKSSPTSRIFCSIMQSFWLKSFIATQTNIDCLKDNKRNDVEDAFRKEINEAVYQWQENGHCELYAFMKMCASYFSKESLTRWVFSKRKMSPNIKTAIGVATNLTFNMMKKYISENVDVEDLPLTVNNFRYLLFILYTYLEKDNVGVGQIERVLNRTLDVAFSDDFYKTIEFEEESINEMRCISVALCKMPKDYVEQKINQCTTIFEGYDFTQYNNIHKYAMHECFFLCACVLMVEQDELFCDNKSKNEWISFLSTHILKQIHVCEYEHLIHDYYSKCLILIELVVTQLVNEYKECFESEIIKHVDDLSTLLTILNIKDVSLSDMNKQTLQERINKELPLIGEVLEQQKNLKLKTFLQGAAKKLLQ